MQFRLLGPVEIEVAGKALPLPRRRERCLLALLLLEANRVVPVRKLATLLWDGDPPDRAQRMIYSHVARLRAVLNDGRNGCHVSLATVGDGYRLDLDPEMVDVHQFRALLQDAASTRDLPGRVDRIQAALDIWRGQPLANAASPWLRGRVCVDLVEQRLTAVEDMLSTSLVLRREREVLPELARIAAEHPGRESLVALHMRGLYQANRKTDALEVYERARAYLADELGLDPGRDLRELRQAILREELDVPEPPQTAAGVSAAPPPQRHPIPHQLPADTASFTGRAACLAQLDALTSAEHTTAVAVTAIGGTAGVGKTALAVHWAHQVAHRFNDGQLYLDLRGFDPDGEPADAAEAIHILLDALGVPPQRIPATLEAQIGLYRSLLAGKRILILLDNARDAEQVRFLLPGSPPSVAVVTSRDSLAGLVAREGAHRIDLDVLPSHEAVALLRTLIGARVDAEAHTAAELADQCARLPLALRICAELATAHPNATLSQLVDDLADEQRRMELLDAGGDPRTAVRTVFSWSYQQLTGPAARLFRLLGLHPGPNISAAAATSLAALPAHRTRPLLNQLSRAHLLTELSPGRYALHDLLRAYATELVRSSESDEQRRAAITRILDHYTHTAHVASSLIYPHRDPILLPLTPPPAGTRPEHFHGKDQAMSWFTTEHQVLLSALRHAASSGSHTSVWQLAWGIDPFMDWQGHWHGLATAWQAALSAACRMNDLRAQAVAHAYLAHPQTLLGRFEDARTHLLSALDLYAQVGDQAGQAHVHHSLSHLYGRQGQPAQALEHGQLALALFRAAGHLRGQAFALNVVGWFRAQLGDHSEAIVYCEEALALFRRIDVRGGQGASWDSLGYAYHHLGHHTRAIECYQQALDVFCELGDRYDEADTLTRLGDTHHATGDPTTAKAAWRQALEILNDLDHPDAEQVRDRINQR